MKFFFFLTAPNSVFSGRPIIKARMEIEQLPVVSFLEEEKQQKSLKRKREKEAKKKEGPTLKPKKVKVNYLERENQAEGRHRDINNLLTLIFF